jgi:hypothetical protein
MKIRSSHLGIIATQIIRTSALLLLLAIPSLAQGNPTFPKPATRDNPTTNPAEFNGRNENITLLERGKDEAQRQQLVMQQMNEDFEKIQSSDRDVLSAVSTTDALDFKRIIDGLTDINKRAVRLKKNMALPAGKPEKDKEKTAQADAGDLRPALVSLNSLITSFVTSPIFKKDSTVDNTVLAKARRDLDGIVDLSDKIRKNVEKTSKASAKP